MPENTVYICTRDRRNNLRKVVPRWLDQKFHVVLVIEQEEIDDTELLCDDMNWTEEEVEVTPLPEVNKGIGYARNWAVKDAERHGHKSIVMSDDDIRPAQDSHMSLLLRNAEKPFTLGVGAVLRIHDHFTKGAITANSGIILCPGGWGGRLYGLNIDTALALGNYDVKLDCLGEDDELKRQGIAAGIPWAVHCDVWAESIGARYQPGGVQALTGLERPRREERCHMLMHQRWPLYVSRPPSKLRMSWQLMLDEYIPGWRNRSAIHGGDWRNGYGTMK